MCNMYIHMLVRECKCFSMTYAIVMLLPCHNKQCTYSLIYICLLFQLAFFIYISFVICESDAVFQTGLAVFSISCVNLIFQILFRTTMSGTHTFTCECMCAARWQMPCLINISFVYRNSFPARGVNQFIIFTSSFLLAAFIAIINTSINNCCRLFIYI